MVKRYGSKRDKALATKGQAAKEGRSVWETERIMDVELFLKEQTQWEEDIPHCLVMLYEMFKHTPDEGQKEAEWTVHHGCQQGLPKLDPEADVSAIQLLGPQTTREEIQSLYLEVYKIQRLPGSLPGEPELMEEVVSSFEDCQGQKEEEISGTTVRPQPLWSGTPGRGTRETLAERSLATRREAHQKVLAMAAALKGG